MKTIGPHRVTHGSLIGPQVDAMLAGERIRVRFQYEAGASMQSLGNAISATPWRRSR